MTGTFSPLRYPGGKYKYVSLFKEIIFKDKKINTFVEPFCGGAGLGLALLRDKIVSSLIINEYDRFIYLFWHSVLHNTSELISLIKKTRLTVEELKKWKKLYTDKTFLNSCNDIEVAYGFFIINRATRSGIYGSGPIGGWEQTGNYKIDARFNKESLINKIQTIASYRSSIILYNYDYKDLIKKLIKDNQNTIFKRSTLFYFDPPYYKMGKHLYNKYFDNSQHHELKQLLSLFNEYKWILSYDDCPEVLQLFSPFKRKNTELNNSVYINRNRNELLFYSDKIYGKFGRFGSVSTNGRRRVDVINNVASIVTR